MGASYLIDSNVVTDYLAGLLPAGGTAFINPIVDAIPRISVITRIEVMGYNPPNASIIRDFVDNAIVLGLTEEVVIKTIALRKSRKIKLPDAIIAATALVNGLTLVTENVGDFTGIQGLTLINPHNLSQNG